MKKSALSCGFLAVTFLLLVACTPSKKMNIPEVTEFLNTVAEDSDSISEGQLERSKDVYLKVYYSLSTDDFPADEREAIFEKTRDFILSPEIKEVIIEEIGEENEYRMLGEGLSIRFQNPETRTYWVYSLKDGEFDLVE